MNDYQIFDAWLDSKVQSGLLATYRLESAFRQPEPCAVFRREWFLTLRYSPGDGEGEMHLDTLSLGSATDSLFKQLQENAMQHIQAIEDARLEAAR